MAQEHYNGQVQGVIGELQYAFIAFVYGQSLDGFAQWKSLLSLLLSCQQAMLHSHQQLFAKVSAAARSHIASLT